MAKIVVTSVTLQTGAEDLQNLNAQFKASVNALNDLEENLSGMWEGDAKEAFRRAFQSDKIQMDNFFNAIEVYVQRLLAAAQRYAQAEAQNVETANNRTYH
ncbi:MAG TPA: WXG100 family type VII secretion target [Candidatus Gemmiger faecigallinarum]|nr:WXG100 family type VII secretion target [Candidatus Gemmiger faecigallinarum]